MRPTQSRLARRSAQGREMIRLKSVQIRRFRGIREGAVRDFADVNLLVGRNNSGKSTVLEAVHRLAYSVSAAACDPLGRGLDVMWNAVRGELEGYPREFWYRLDQTAPIELVAEVGRGDSKGVETIRLSVLLKANVGTPMPTFDYRGKAGLPHDAIFQFLSRATAFRTEDARNGVIERMLWQPILAARHDKALTAAINAIFNQSADSCTLLDGKVWLVFPDYAVPLDSQGEGSRAALRCLILFTVLRQTIFIAGEVECHQHPASLDRFAKALCKQARGQEVQLFLSTHSSECVRAFLAGARDAGLEAAVFHTKLEDGILDATRLESAATETLLDTGVDVRFLDLYG